MKNINLTQAQLRDFEEILETIVDSNGPWTDKRDELKSMLSEAAFISLQELAAWYNEPDQPTLPGLDTPIEPTIKTLRGTNEKLTTKLMRYEDHNGKKRWIVFNHQGEQFRARPSHSKTQSLGIFASKYPITVFSSLARLSEMAATLCEYPDPNPKSEETNGTSESND
jgi:hypothetical protein